MTKATVKLQIDFNTETIARKAIEEAIAHINDNYLTEVKGEVFMDEVKTISWHLRVNEETGRLLLP